MQTLEEDVINNVKSMRENLINLSRFRMYGIEVSTMIKGGKRPTDY